MARSKGPWWLGEKHTCNGMQKQESKQTKKPHKHLAQVAIGCKTICLGCSRVLSGNEQLGAVNTAQMQPGPQVPFLKVAGWGRDVFQLTETCVWVIQGLCNSLCLKLDLYRTGVKPRPHVRYRKGLDLLSICTVPRNGCLLASLRPPSLDTWPRTWAE